MKSGMPQDGWDDQPNAGGLIMSRPKGPLNSAMSACAYLTRHEADRKGEQVWNFSKIQVAPAFTVERIPEEEEGRSEGTLRWEYFRLMSLSTPSGCMKCLTDCSNR